MKEIYLYNFYKTKYGKELLIDVINLTDIKKNISKRPIHRLTYYDITFIIQGSEEICINENKLQVGPDKAVSSIPGDVWQWNPNTSLEGYVLVFEEEFLLSFFNDPYFLQNLSYLKSDRTSSLLVFDPILFDRIINLLVHIKEEINIKEETDQHILRAMLYELLILLNRSNTASGNKTNTNNNLENRHLNSFIEMVKVNYIEDRNINNYADKINITSNYLNKIVRKYIDISPKKYIELKVVEESKRLLAYTSLSIAEISDRLYFCTPSYFGRFFQKFTTLTPLEYRNRNKKF